MERDSFVFRKEWYDAISGMPEKVRAEVYVAIVEYAFTGEAPKLKSMAQMAFTFIKADLDKQAHNAKVSRARSEAGKKGVQAKLEKANSVEAVSDVSKKSASNAPERPSKTPLELLEGRKKEFYDSLVPYVEKYGKLMIRDFFNYWSEANKSRTKMRFELQKTWETSRRLVTWAYKTNEFNGGNRKYNQEIAAAQDALEVMQRIKSRAGATE